MRHPYPGPGLAIRVICGEERYIEKDYSETQVLVKIIVEYDQMLKKVSDSTYSMFSNYITVCESSMYLGLWDFWARLLSLSESLDKSINQAKCKIAHGRVAVKKY